MKLVNGDYSSMSEEIIKALDGKLQTMPKGF